MAARVPLLVRFLSEPPPLRWIKPLIYGFRSLPLPRVDKLLVDFQADMRRIKGAGR